VNIPRRTFAKSLTAGAFGSFLRPWSSPAVAQAAQARTPAPLAQAAARLPKAIVTKVRVLTPKTGSNRNSVTAAFNQSNMIILVDTDAGVTGIGEGGSPDLVNILSQSVIGRDAMNTELIWDHMYMDAFYSPGHEKLDALGGIDMALWDIKAKLLGVPLYMLLGGKVREHVQLYATAGLPPGVQAGPSLKERAAATMAAGYYCYRVDGGIQPNPGLDGVLNTGRGGGGAAGGAAGVDAGAAARGAGAGGRGGGAGGRGGGAAGAAAPARGGGGGGGQGQMFDTRARILAIAKAGEQIREGIGPEGNWFLDVHQKFDFQEVMEIARLLEPTRPFMLEDPVREEEFRTQIPKLRQMTILPLAPGEEYGHLSEFQTLIENRDIDYVRATLPNVGGITEMLKIMAVCDSHKVGIVPHFTGAVACAAHIHFLTSFSGQVMMEYNFGSTMPQHLLEFVDFHDGKCWPNDRPGLGVTLDMAQLDPVAEYTTAIVGNTYRRRDGSPTRW
jgi:L-alanine-DL-glutamate epimerase-like enolase superfamily enzyme